jgi:UDP-glucose 4-epimerase
MNILITGVAGFIGSNFALNMLKEGYSVTGVDNFEYGYKRNLEELLKFKDFEFIEGDIRNISILKNINADYVVHLASHKIPLKHSPISTLDDNYIMTKNVIEFCKIHKAKLIFASTSDVYGKNTDLPFNENSNIVMGQPDVRRWVYSISKLYSEHLITASHTDFGLQYTIVRFFGSYGENQNITYKGGPQSVFINAALKKQEMTIHGDGSQTRTFSYIKDVIEALKLCTIDNKSYNEIFNIAGNPNEEISILNLAKLIWKLINKHEEPKIKFIPYESFGKWDDIKRRVPDISKLKNTFNFNPNYNLESGLIKTIEWQKKIVK